MSESGSVGANRLAEAVVSFYTVREMPYAIDKAHDRASLDRLGAGDCLAKAELLAETLTMVGVETRLVRWPYHLPDVVPEVRLLPSTLDLHRAVEALIDGEWKLVDATHDAALAVGGLTVADWDGRRPTEPAYRPRGPILVEGRDQDQIDAMLAEITAWTASCDALALHRWRTSYVAWLASVREFQRPFSPAG